VEISMKRSVYLVLVKLLVDFMGNAKVDTKTAETLN
jgi:hypothetical protein